MKLPVRIRPLEGESFHGYLLRLASQNGYTTYPELANVLGVDRRIKSCPIENEIMTTAEKIAPILLMEPEEFVSYFNELYSLVWLYSGIRDIRSVYVKQPRLCSACLISDKEPFFRFDWALLPNTHCPAHGKELLDCCPKCEAPLPWNSDVFQGCSSCGFQWNEYDQEESGIPTSQDAFQKLRQENGFAGGIHAWLDDFTSNVLKAARPHDQFHDQIDCIPISLKHICELIRQACTPYSRKDACLLDFPPEGFVKPRRLKYRDSIRYHCKHDQMATELGLSSGERFSALVEQGIIKPIHDTPVLRDMLFDIRDAEALLVKCRRSSNVSSDCITIDGSSEVLGRYDTFYGELLAATIVEKLLLIPSDAKDLSELIVPREWLAAFLQRNLRKNCVGNISINRASKILGKPPSAIKEMICHQQLVEGYSRGFAKLVTADSVLAILNGYCGQAVEI